MGQLVYASSGAFTTMTSVGTWIAPFNRVAWTPPGLEHAHRFAGHTDVRLVELPTELSDRLPPLPAVFVVGPLLREALRAASERPDLAPAAGRRLLAVIVDELTETVDESLHLPEPAHDRLRAATRILHADPAQATTLTELGRRVGVSERTLSRLFHVELGMSFHQWRSMLRIHKALLLLTEGSSVTDTAMDCGWSNPSSFIETFTRIVGRTPGTFQAELRAQLA